jgi:hypothetical protein
MRTRYALIDALLTSETKLQLRACVVALLAFGMLSFEHVNAEIACPDEKALELVRIAGDWKNASAFTDSAAAYAHVINEARRAMDEPALVSACFRFAYDRYREVHCSGHECNVDPVQFNAAIPDLVSRFPILQLCPRRSISRNSWLPIVRVAVSPPPAAIAGGLTGWVEFRITINEAGAVEYAVLLESSDKALEETSTEAVLRFRYEPRLNDEFQPIRVEGVSATVYTTYFDLARASGCIW